MMQVKVYTAWNKPKAKKQNVHQEIYEYQYMDKKTGELKTNKINVQEKIQSNLEKVNYKKMIERGELLLNGGSMGEGIRDYTSISGDKVDFIDFIAKIGRMGPEQINTLVKQVNQTPKDETRQDNKTNGETTSPINKNQSDDSGNITENNQGGTE